MAWQCLLARASLPPPPLLRSALGGRQPVSPSSESGRANERPLGQCLGEFCLREAALIWIFSVVD